MESPPKKGTPGNIQDITGPYIASLALPQGKYTSTAAAPPTGASYNSSGSSATSGNTIVNNTMAQYENATGKTAVPVSASGQYNGAHAPGSRQSIVSGVNGTYSSGGIQSPVAGRPGAPAYDSGMASQLKANPQVPGRRSPASSGTQMAGTALKTFLPVGLGLMASSAWYGIAIKGSYAASKDAATSPQFAEFMSQHSWFAPAPLIAGTVAIYLGSRVSGRIFKGVMKYSSGIMKKIENKKAARELEAGYERLAKAAALPVTPKAAPIS
ncbi:MAG: hypothetical protein JW727_04825 [Candidatus Aenigmarchaeota archaeon]|nr:hypothetical protein [Candidatus Aenigmarchaeota archaeon]